MKSQFIKKTVLASMVAGGIFAMPAAWAAKDVTVAVEITFDSLDPYNTNSTLAQAVGKGYYEGLFAFDKDLKIQPLLAESVEPNEDGTVFTLHLRKGVKFHDGTDFDANAEFAS